MRNLTKKSSFCLLLATLMLLVALLVGTAVSASAEEVDYEATLYNENGTVRSTGTLTELLSSSAQMFDGLKGKIVLHKDAELTSAVTVRLGRIVEIDGQGHTVYIAEALNTSATTKFITVSSDSKVTDTVIFRNIKFNGQKMGWDGTNPLYFAASGSTSGAITVTGANVHFEMIDCRMENFYTNGMTICLSTALHSATYYPNGGIYLKNTVITNNHSARTGDGYSAAAIRLAQYGAPAEGAYGSKIHVFGNTQVVGNYNGDNQNRANIAVQQSKTDAEGYFNGSTVVIVEEDFTGEIHLSKANHGNLAGSTNRRALVFFRGNSYDADGDYIRRGIVYGYDWTAYAEPIKGELVNFCDDDETIRGSWITTPKTPTAPKSTSSLIVIANGKELFTYSVKLAHGGALPAWATWSNGKNTVTTHTFETKTYTGTVAESTEALLSYDGGKNWIIGTVKQGWTARNPANTAALQYTNVEVCRDYVLAETISAGYNCSATFDFNGFTVTRLAETYQFHAQGTNNNHYMSMTIKNANFEGKIGETIPADGKPMFNLVYAERTVSFENCTFSNFKSTTNSASVINIAYRGFARLKDVVMTNCEGKNGTISISGACADATVENPNMGGVYVEGNTQIANTADTTNQIVYAYNLASFVGVSGTFTGNVQVSTNGISDNMPTFCKASSTAYAGTDIEERLRVPEGAKILGKIFVSNYIAYNNNGYLCWIRPGIELDTTHVVAPTYNAENNTLSGGKGWYYNTGAEGAADVYTTKAVTGVYNYFLKDGIETDAVINASTLIYGDLATVLASASAGQTVEILRDVKGLANLSIPNSCTVDGNGKTLTVYVGEESPTLDGGGKWYLIKTLASGVTLKDLNISGGAAQKGIWAGALSPQNLALINFTGSQTLTMENCKVSGLRLQTDDTFGTTGLIIVHNSAGNLNLKDCEFTDNMVMIPQASTASKVYNSAKIWFRVYSNGNMNLEGKIVIKDNWSITSDGVTAIPDNLTDVVAARLHVGQLAEGSHIEMRYSAEYTPITDDQGKLYDNTGYFYYYTPANMRTVASYPNGLTGSASKTGGVLCYNGATVLLIAKSGTAITDPARQASVDSDKVDFRYLLTVNADYFGTDVVVKINGDEAARTPLYDFTPSAKVIAVPVAVGMAELADEIVIELQDASGAVLASTSADTVKAYALSILEGEYVATMKTAIASLLQYGAMVQTHFGHNTDNLAMTAEDLESWTALGITLKAIDSNTLNTAGATVGATASGTLPASVTIQGATLTMENEMSLRLYVKATGDVTFTVNGNAASLKTDTAGRTYIEASHIGTASLATAATFTVSDGTSTYTYKASPMSYVYTVHTATHSSITANLKNACEALYYYYEAIAAHFELANDTGFAGGSVLETASDTPNNYSPLYVS